METKFRIVEIDDYILAVSDEEIKPKDIFLADNLYIVTCNNLVSDTFVNGNFYRSKCKKIIAYQPKNNAKELDLPLLPEIVVEDNVEKLAQNADKSKCKHFRREHTKEEVYDSFEEGFIEGYNKCLENLSK